MEGGYDPDCRRTFDWDESHWNKTVFAAVKRLIGVRKKIVSEEINYAAQGGLRWSGTGICCWLSIIRAALSAVCSAANNGK